MPYYITAMFDYMQKSGDIDFIKKSWESMSRKFHPGMPWV